LAVEVKNSAKLTLLSFNRTAIFLYDAMASENDILEGRKFTWRVCLGDLV